jgi:predicted N-acetyltransferase YhbS
MSGILIRPLKPDDGVQEITALLHRAYRRNADMDIHFVASHQDIEVTKERLANGPSFIAELDGKIVGTITLTFPMNVPHAEYMTDRPLASFGQFAVEPGLQKAGIGRRLIETVEKEAIQLGAEEICLDTAQPAVHLIAYYERLGYEIRAEADWRPEVNYKSWVMVKTLVSVGTPQKHK